MLLLQNYEIFNLLSRLFFFSRALEAGFCAREGYPIEKLAMQYCPTISQL